MVSHSPQSVTYVIPAFLFVTLWFGPRRLQRAVTLPLPIPSAAVSGHWALTPRYRPPVHRQQTRASPGRRSRPSPAGKGPGPRVRLPHNDRKKDKNNYRPTLSSLVQFTSSVSSIPVATSVVAPERGKWTSCWTIRPKLRFPYSWQGGRSVFMTPHEVTAAWNTGCLFCRLIDRWVRPRGFIPRRDNEKQVPVCMLLPERSEAQEKCCSEPGTMQKQMVAAGTSQKTRT